MKALTIRISKAIRNTNCRVFEERDWTLHDAAENLEEFAQLKVGDIVTIFTRSLPKGQYISSFEFSHMISDKLYLTDATTKIIYHVFSAQVVDVKRNK